MKKEISEVFEIIEKELENEYQSRLSQKDLRKREKADNFLIERLAGCCIGIKNDAIYRVQQIKRQYDYKLRIHRGEKEQEQLCANCEKCCEGFYHHECEEWEKIYKKMHGDE